MSTTAHTSLFDLSGQVAIVTGASRGIGRATAERLAQHGARVVVSSRDRQACEAVVAAIAARGGEALAQACHVGHRDQLQPLVDAALQRWGRLDTLVCNAAVNPYFGPAADMPDEVYERVMNHNLRSAFWLCNLALPHMAVHGVGSVILMSSIGGLQGSDKLGVYSLSKAALMQLARNLAVEWGARGVRANAIAPGLVETDFARQIWSDPERRRRAEEMSPLQRIGTPDDVAGVAVFLASAAARFLTGQTLLVDGGRSITNRVGGQ